MPRDSRWSNGEVIARLREAKRWSQAELAARADLSPRLIQKAEAGQKKTDLGSLEAIAKALNVDLSRVLRGLPPVPVPGNAESKEPVPEENPLKVIFQVPGNPGDPQQHRQIEDGLQYVEAYAKVNPTIQVVAVVGGGTLVRDLLQATAAAGETSTRAGLDPDDYARVIVLVYGKLNGRGPCWCYVAVKPSRYLHFLHAQKTARLNLFEFDPFGEIIVSGDGEGPPPDEVTLKVAEVYQTDPKKFFQPMDPLKQIVQKMKRIEAKQIAENMNNAQKEQQ
jgi:transcriptional regulator with XRE-family HTH domain